LSGPFVKTGGSGDFYPQILLGSLFLRDYSTFFSINKIHRWLKSQSIKLGIATLHDYIDYFESACFIEPVRLFTDSIKREQVNPFKLYLVDHGLSRTAAPNFSQKQGQALENIVALHLLQFANRVYYYKTRSGYEIDFVWQGGDGVFNAAQVSYGLLEGETLEREIRAISQCREELSLERVYLIVAPGTFRPVLTEGIEFIDIISFLLSDGMK
jgi:predicted AAA+ superfamily ATPase